MEFKIRVKIRRLDPKKMCPNCRGYKYKIVRTHGSKSTGIKVCKKCGGVI